MYSYGVVLLTLISGRRPTEAGLPEDEVRQFPIASLLFSQASYVCLKRVFEVRLFCQTHEQERLIVDRR